MCSLLRSAKTLRSYDTISSTLLVTRPVQSTSPVHVPYRYLRSDPLPKDKGSVIDIVMSLVVSLRLVDYLLGTGLNDFLVDRAG